MASKVKNFIFLGAPAAGKGSYGKAIAKKVPGFLHVSVGDLFRGEVAKGSEFGLQIKNKMGKGLLLPDSYADTIALNFFKDVRSNKLGGSASKHVQIILDGYPRTLSQAEFLSEHLGDQEDFTAVHIALEKWVAIEKTLGRKHCKNCNRGFNTADIRVDGYYMPPLLPNKDTCPLGPAKCDPQYETRSDDTLEIAEVRYQEYLAKTAPLLDYYAKKGQLKTFQVKKGLADTDLLIELLLR